MREPSAYLRNPESLQTDAAWPRKALFFAEEEEGLDLSESWRVVRKHLRLIVATVASVLVLTGLLVLNTTRLYTASSTILIEPNAPRALDIKEMMSEAPGPDEHNYYKTQYDILRSRTLAADVIRTCDLEDNPLFTGEKKDQGFIGGLWARFSLWAAPLLTQRKTQSDDIDGGKPELIVRYLKRLAIEPRLDTRLVEVAFTTPDPTLSARIANAH